jgi:hypothetical protein
MPNRNNKWLLERLTALWQRHFSDVPLANRIVIQFSRQSKYRFGSIRFLPDQKVSLILINGMFKKTTVPEEVVDHTIAHELTHYIHGFSSTKQRLHSHPHRGGVIDKEMRRRGMSQLLIAYKLWVRTYLKEI